MTAVEQKIGEVRAILAGHPLAPSHEEAQRRLARLKLGELKLFIVDVPHNERQISVDTIQDAIAALDTPGSQRTVLSMLGGLPGVLPPGHVEIATVGRTAETASPGAPRPAGTGVSVFRTYLRLVLIGVATGITTALVLRAAFKTDVRGGRGRGR